MTKNAKINIALLCGCLTCIGIMAGIRMKEADIAALEASRNTAQVALGANSSPAPEALGVEPTFYDPDGAPSSSTSAPLPSPTKPTPIPVPSPTVSAEAYIVGNIATAHIYLSRNPAQVLPIASITKLVTAMAATELYPASTEMRVTSEETNVPPDASNLQPGEQFTLGDLLYPMLLNSSNVAAEVIASSSDRLGFLRVMAEDSRKAGMTSTNFSDPTGLSSGNMATANDIFSLARYIYVHRPDILAITRMSPVVEATSSEHGSHIFASIHPFSGDPAFLGGKTGRTNAAGETMLTILNINDQPVAIIILGSGQGNRAVDTTLLRDKVKALITAQN